METGDEFFCDFELSGNSDKAGPPCILDPHPEPRQGATDLCRTGNKGKEPIVCFNAAVPRFFYCRASVMPRKYSIFLAVSACLGLRGIVHSLSFVGRLSFSLSALPLSLFLCICLTVAVSISFLAVRACFGLLCMVNGRGLSSTYCFSVFLPDGPSFSLFILFLPFSLSLSLRSLSPYLPHWLSPFLFLLSEDVQGSSEL